MARLVDVLFPVPLDHPFTYEIPSDLPDAGIGCRVLAPFGKRVMTGYVVGLPSSAGDIRPRPLQAVLDDLPLTPSLIELAGYLARSYGAPLGEALAVVLPPGLIRQTKRKIRALEREGEPEGKEAKEWLARVRGGRGLDYTTAVRRFPSSTRILRTLEREGWISIENVLSPEWSEKRKRAEAPRDRTFEAAPEKRLTAAQETAVDRMESALVRGDFHSFLLHGITGSGKTEIYLKMAAATLSRGRTVLALVPEISLTPQFVGRFRARFGERVALLHSGRSDGERIAEWRRIRAQEATVVIGARSAVFAPLERIGLIVVDEEHDSSYKQEEGLSYHGRDLARHRALREKAILLLGSATPSLETYEASERGEIERLELPSRATEQDLPSIEVVDLKSAGPSGVRRTLLSSILLEAIRQTLSRREQVVLFLNRRGFAPVVLCPSCGEGVRCLQCSVALTYHQREKVLLCHYCGATAPESQACRQCGRSDLWPIGVGTERVEKELAHWFPDARIARMDRDSVRGRGKHEAILRSLHNGEIDILIGTQMVTKGLDFEHVTLVGVLLADQSLNFPDFRAAERTFQLLTQVSGRAGRGAKKGRAILQTFQPGHYAVTTAAAHDYRSFYTTEVEARRLLGYPPFRDLVLLELKGKDFEATQSSARWLGTQARTHLTGAGRSGEVLGPAPAPILRLNGKVRFHLLLRLPRLGKEKERALWLASRAHEPLRRKGVDLRVVVDPLRFL